MRDDITIEELDLGSLDERAWRSLHAVAAAVDFEALPQDRPAPFEEFQADWRRRTARTRHRRWAAWRQDGSVAGFATMELDDEENTHAGWGWIAVDPAQRRGGVGSALLASLAAALVDEKRRTLAIPARHGGPGVDFLPVFGFEERLVEHRNRLVVSELDLDLLHGWVERAKERAAGYSLRWWTDHTPAELLPALAQIHDAMNDAPRGELDWEDEHVTAAELVEREQSRLDAGIHWWTAAAIDDATGTLAGFTQLYFSEWREEIAFQGDTGVDPAHRERGLGRWIKAAQLLRLLDERPSVEKVDTWNAGSNAPMLGINHALGFRPIEVWGDFQADVDVVGWHLEAGR